MKWVFCFVFLIVVTTVYGSGVTGSATIKVVALSENDEVAEPIAAQPVFEAQQESVVEDLEVPVKNVRVEPADNPVIVVVLLLIAFLIGWCTRFFR